MSQSPYAGTMSPMGYESSPPARTSVLAVLSVVAAVLCVPGTGLLAILLGAIALAGIGRSNGRVEGRGAAISGIILGLITTVLWGAAALGVLQGWTYYTKNMVSAGDRFFQAAAQGDYDAVRAEMTTDAAAAVTDEQFAWFISEIESREGEVLGASTSFNTMFNSFGAVFGSSRGGGSNGNIKIEQSNDDVIAPVAVQCDSGSIIAWFVYDGDSFDDVPESSPKIVDAFIQFANQDVLTLRNDGPAARSAELSGLAPSGVIQPEEAEAPTPPEPDEDDFPTPDRPESPDNDAPTS